MRQADTFFAKEREQLVTAGAESGFFEIEYGKPLTEEMFAHALNDIHAALENFYAADSVWTLLASAMRLVPQRTLSFGHAASTVQVRPDLIAFYPSLAPVVFDWKVNTRPLRDYWLQLVTGALALTRCTPHRDWPLGGALYDASDVQLLEVQLLVGDTRCHRATAADVEDAEDFISSSMAEMEFAYQCDVGDEPLPEDFPVANDPFVCQVCPFKKPCWGQTG